MEKTFDYLASYDKENECKVRFSVITQGGKRGVYLREPRQLNKPVEVNVTIEPHFCEKQSGKCYIQFNLFIWTSELCFIL